MEREALPKNRMNCSQEPKDSSKALLVLMKTNTESHSGNRYRRNSTTLIHKPNSERKFLSKKEDPANHYTEILEAAFPRITATRV